MSRLGVPIAAMFVLLTALFASPAVRSCETGDGGSVPDYVISLGSSVDIDVSLYHGSVSGVSIEEQSGTDVVTCDVSGSLIRCAANSNGYSDIRINITYSCGGYSEDSFRITVSSEEGWNEAPVIDSLYLYPENPTRFDDISCRAEVSDRDSNLDYVRFRWYVNNDLVKAQDREAYGGSDNVQSVLYYGVAGEGDTVACEATVYDTSGLSYTSRVEKEIFVEQECGTDVHGLSYSDGKITFGVRNTGIRESSISYSLRVDGSVVKTGVVSLSPGEDASVTHDYYLSGDGSITVEAEADCGSKDTETVSYSVLPEYELENPSVDYVRIVPSEPDAGDTLYCRASFSDPDGDLDHAIFEWRVGERLERNVVKRISGGSDYAEDRFLPDAGDGERVECSVRVYDQRGRSGYGSDYVYIEGPSAEEECGISITALDYSDWIVEGNKAYVTTTVENSGDGTNAYVRVYDNGRLKRQVSSYIGSGERKVFHSSFAMEGAGTHKVRIYAGSSCGSSESMEFEIYVAEISPVLACNYNGVCEEGESYTTCPHDCAAPEPEREAKVSISPLSMDVVQHRSKAIAIDIYSQKEQGFAIEATGVPEDWLSYSREERVEGNKRVWVYVTPRNTGFYTLHVKVRALAESREFEANIELFVAPPESRSAAVTGNAEAFSVSATAAYIIIAICSLVAVVAAYVSHSRMFGKAEKDFRIRMIGK